MENIMKKHFFVALALGISFFLVSCDNLGIKRNSDTEIDKDLVGTWEAERKVDNCIRKVTLTLSLDEDEESWGIASLKTSVSIEYTGVSPSVEVPISFLDKTHSYTKWYIVDSTEFYLSDSEKELSLGGYTLDKKSSPSKITFSKGFSYTDEDGKLSLPFTEFVKK